MSPVDETAPPRIAAITVGDRTYDVTLRIAHDGIEYVGRLWFAESEWDDAGIPDHGILPGRTRDEVDTLARRLSESDLLARYGRAVAHTRRYHALRTVTDEFLRKVRYLNQVAVSMRAGLLDLEGAAQEIDYTEKQLHEIVARLRDVAGVEELRV
ncbi:MAG TPA: hypothetical protein VF722_05225 [Gemmatimonadaceae bacterium]|jgi:hypothetical protein